MVGAKQMSNPITIKLVTPDGTEFLEVHGTTNDFVYGLDDLMTATITVEKTISTNITDSAANFIFHHNKQHGLLDD